MRPLQLVLQAFGPYAGIEKIDFSLLGNRNMFVISERPGQVKRPYLMELALRYMEKPAETIETVQI